MIKRSKIASIILLIAINILLLSLCTKNAFAGLESESIAATLTKLMTLGQAIQAKWISDGGAADTPIYPGGASMPCEASWESGAPCWAYTIAGGDNAGGTAYGGKMMEDLGQGGDLFIDMSDLQGDIRFRCRTQGRQTYCFAYHCLDVAPAGCKQIWRIEWKVDPANLYGGNRGKCTQTMAGDAIPGEDWSPTCDSWFNPDPNSW